jgi:hypothetical protein
MSTIDVLTHSSKSIVEALRIAAYGINATPPLGGYDIPSPTALMTLPNTVITSELSEVTDFIVTFHVEPEQDDCTDQVGVFSSIKELQPMPSDTRSPFVHPFEELRPPGLMGTALTAYLEAKATLAQYGYESEGWDDLMAKQWGLSPEDTDRIKLMTVGTRSDGAAFWGGLSAKLVPCAAVYYGSGPLATVRATGSNRFCFGPNANVNWSKLQELARLIAVRLAVEEQLPHKGHTTLRFTINQNNIPMAPNKLNLDNNSFREMAQKMPKWRNMSSKGSILEYFNAQLYRAQQMVAMSRVESVEVPRELLCNPTVLALFVKKRMALPYLGTQIIRNNIFTNPKLQELDLAEPCKQIKPTAARAAIADLGNIWMRIAQSKPPGVKPTTHRQVNNILKAYDAHHEDSMEAWLNVALPIINEFYPSNTLSVVFRLLLLSDKSTAFCNLAKALLVIQAREHYLRDATWAIMWRTITTDPRCVSNLLRQIVRALTESFRDTLLSPVTSYMVTNLFTNAVTIDAGLKMLITGHMERWASWYYEKAFKASEEIKSMGKRKKLPRKAQKYRDTLVTMSVQNQFLFSMYKAVKVAYVGDDYEICNTFELRSNIKSKAERSIAKQGFKKRSKINIPEPGPEAILEYLIKLDKAVNPKVCFSNLWRLFLEKFALTLDDVKKQIANALSIGAQKMTEIMDWEIRKAPGGAVTRTSREAGMVFYPEDSSRTGPVRQRVFVPYADRYKVAPIAASKADELYDIGEESGSEESDGDDEPELLYARASTSRGLTEDYDDVNDEEWDNYEARLSRESGVETAATGGDENFDFSSIDLPTWDNINVVEQPFCPEIRLYEELCSTLGTCNHVELQKLIVEKYNVVDHMGTLHDYKECAEYVHMHYDRFYGHNATAQVTPDLG